MKPSDNRGYIAGISHDHFMIRGNATMEISNEISKIMEVYMRRERITKLERYRQLNRYAQKKRIVFAGSSLAEQFPIHELAYGLPDCPVIYNRGIGGDTTGDMLCGDSMDVCIFELEPSRLFINIGSNDIGEEDYNQEKLIENYTEILARIQKRMPETEVFLLSYYPVNPEKESLFSPKEKRMMFASRTNTAIRDANSELKKLAGRYGYGYIDVSSVLTGGNGALKADYTVEGIHLWPDAYARVLEVLKPYLLVR